MDVLLSKNKFELTGKKELDIINANMETIRIKRAYVNNLRHLSKILRNSSLETDSWIGRANNRELNETIQEINHAESSIQKCESHIVQYLEPILENLNRDCNCTCKKLEE
ncbi:hypothetical protein [Methanobacterium spitsbergense]|uniref:Uncharacterized protein n=1 Tax=Methanobacterium spitsbergense TaxID=2874285 RepID=A0A8T5UVK7_9EURY|nr:hypothetical protein [Methanobacterium spitsbergense]MBZ2165210.1 hypothetical protein [Methanobacterium spitsbergense]